MAVSHEIRQSVFAFALFWVILMTLTTNTAAQSQSKVLRNDDIIQLTKAGLTDTAIVNVIRRSKIDFDLSSSGLVALKSAGVKDKVIEAMTGIPDQGEEANSNGTNPASGAIHLPKEYGYYLVEGDHLTKINPVPVRTVVGLRPGNAGAGWAVDGVPGNPSFVTDQGNPEFIFYQQHIDIQAARYGSAVFVSSIPAKSFEITGSTNPQLFPALYGHNYEEQVAVNLWRPISSIRFGVEPVIETPGMFRLRTAGTLEPGRYIIFFDNMLHLNGSVFATQQDEPFFAILFDQSAVTCGDFNKCLGEGIGALQAEKFDIAVHDLQKAAQQNPTDALPWINIGRAYVGLNRTQDAVAAWDKALSLHSGIGFPACRERGIQVCERGNLDISADTVSFVIDRQPVFQSPIAQVSVLGAVVHKFQGRANFSIEVQGKKFNLDFIPPGEGCTISAHVNCLRDALDRQSAIGDYVAAAIMRLQKASTASAR